MLMKMVNGEVVQMSAKEEAAFLADRASQQAPVVDAPRSKEEILADIDAIRAEVETLSTLDQLQALSNG